MRMPNGYGTVTKLSGNRRKPYAVRVPIHDKRGRVHQKYLSYHTTAREATDALLAYNQQKTDGTAIQPGDLGVTLRDVYQQWSARKYKKAGKASVTSYKASWNRVSVLASLPIRKIGIDQLQEIIDRDEELGLSKSSITNDNLLIKALFAFAMERDYITKDYSSFMKLPRDTGPKHEKGTFTDIQLKKLEALAADGLPWADTILILCYTGYRISELLSRTRFNYDAEENALKGGLKTASGRARIIPVHPKIKPYLMNWLAKGGETIICSKDGAAITSAWYRKHAFAPIVQMLGAPQATPHWCRHTFATRLHEAGVPDLEQKRLLGHADSNVTEHYTHENIAVLRNEIIKLA